MTPRRGSRLLVGALVGALAVTGADVDILESIPLTFHRSHRFTQSELDAGASAKARRVRDNLASCTRVNPNATQRYFDDDALVTEVEFFLEELPDPSVTTQLRRAWHKLASSEHGLANVPVMRADFFRLAVVHRHGGWWLDADVVCLDPVSSALGTAPALREELARRAEDRSYTCDGDAPLAPVGCAFAWEGDVRGSSSSPLNWAFGCAPRHPFLLHALEALAERVLAWHPGRPSPVAPEFCARSTTLDGLPVLVPVLYLTGPSLVEHALTTFTQRRTEGNRTATTSLHDLRLQAGERLDDESTWDRATLVAADGAGAVLVLPYCFFRSRGCPHLAPRFQDRVVFHHEFDTDWRVAYWHNYHQPAPSVEQQRLHGRLAKELDQEAEAFRQRSRRRSRKRNREATGPPPR